jgi:hypothetical protein
MIFAGPFITWNSFFYLRFPFHIKVMYLYVIMLLYISKLFIFLSQYPLTSIHLVDYTDITYKTCQDERNWNVKADEADHK